MGLQKKEDKTAAVITQNKEATLDKARQFVYGTGQALKADPEKDKFNTVASDLNNRAELIVGPPPYEQAIEMDKIVAGLLSTNKQLKLDAEKLLGKKDAEIIGLQEKLADLEGKLNKIQKEKEDVSFQNSVLANKWHSLVKWVKIVFWAVVIGAGLALLSQLLSVILPPPYNGVFSAAAIMVSWLVRMVFSLFPNSKQFAKVIPQEEYQKSENTLKSLVDALQEIRNTEIKPESIIPKSSSVKIKDLIDSTLKSTTNTNDRIKIDEIKKSLGYI
jgi:hypothetical protein